MKNVSTYDVFRKQMSPHEPNHRLNGDEPPHGGTHYVQRRISGIFEQKYNTETYSQPKKL